MVASFGFASAMVGDQKNNEADQDAQHAFSGNALADSSVDPLYVMVNLDPYAHDSSGLNISEIKPRVPIQIIKNDLNDHVFMRAAEWIDWRSDPADFHEPYDTGFAKKSDPRMLMFQIPVADYECVYVLGASDNSSAYVPKITFRIGKYGGALLTVQHDYAAQLPRFMENDGVGVEQKWITTQGNIFLLKIPIAEVFAQDFPADSYLDVELTKELRLAIRAPAPLRFRYRPLGEPSGARIFGITFKKAPIQMKVISAEPGNVFNETDKPSFKIQLNNIDRKRHHMRIVANVTDFYGNTTVTESDLVVEGDSIKVQALTFDLKKRGHYTLKIALYEGSQMLLSRTTSFALLMQDSRKFRGKSPFGVWDFSGLECTPYDPDLVGRLYVKAGLRYGMFSFKPDARNKHGVLQGYEAISVEEFQKMKETDPKTPDLAELFHEPSISETHGYRVPDAIVGRSPYILDMGENNKFEKMRQDALQISYGFRKKYPDVKILLGNGFPLFLEEMLRHKFSSDLFDYGANEAHAFMRMPETQPTDILALNACIWMERQLLDHYGYREKSIITCYENCYPNTNPGNLTMATQASYYVRHAMHCLAWEMPFVRIGCLADAGNSYKFSSWGSSGLCYGLPDVVPKPSYVAIAVMTQLLDGARFARVIPLGSASLYGLEFTKQDGKIITVLWTLRGTCPTKLIIGDRQTNAQIYDLMGNDVMPRPNTDNLFLDLSSSPIYIVTPYTIANIIPGKSIHEGEPKGGTALVSALLDADEWRVESDNNLELEWYDCYTPRRKGVFSFVSASSFEGESAVLKVTPRIPTPGPETLPMYAILRHKKGIMIPGMPTKIGVFVNGNSGWGRVIFELEDAGGQRWISIGAERKDGRARWMPDWFRDPQDYDKMKQGIINDWHTDDAWGRSRINFDGWRYLDFPLPGNYPGERYHWPYNSQWRWDGDGIVKYPLTFKKLIVELPEKVLHFKSFVSVQRPSIYLKNLRVTYLSPEEAFCAE